jgi:hypothetical protein
MKENFYTGFENAVALWICRQKSTVQVAAFGAVATRGFGMIVINVAIVL